MPATNSNRIGNVPLVPTHLPTLAPSEDGTSPVETQTLVVAALGLAAHDAVAAAQQPARRRAERPDVARGPHA